jgi:hypothetical protein
MTRISVPGNEGGFVLLDALVCLFTAALILLFLAGAVSTTLRSSFKALDDGIGIIDARNSAATLPLGGGKNDER